MATKLSVYNGIMIALGQRHFEALTEQREERRIIDTEWDRGMNYCLGQAQWNFALRAQELDDDPAVSTSGYDYAFAKPSDWIRTSAISLSETYNPPLTDYLDKRDYLFANGTPLYLRYISSDATNGGGALTQWPLAFEEYVIAHFARRLYPRFATGSGQNVSGAYLQELSNRERRALINASGKDVMNESVRFKPTGSWVNSRSGGYRRLQRREDS